MTHDKLVLLVTQRVVAEKRMPRGIDIPHSPLENPGLELLEAFIGRGLEQLEDRFESFITQRSRLAALRNSSR